VDVIALITTCALIVAVLAFARVVHIVARFGDDRATALSRAFVVHGAACLTLAAADFVADPLGLPLVLQILAGLMTAAWGATWVIVGRAYDPDMPTERRLDELDAAKLEERGRRPARSHRFEHALTSYLAERERS
jgi:hypothetical protein